MKKIGLAVVCISDRSADGTREDLSGPAISEACRDLCDTLIYTIIADDYEKIKTGLLNICRDERIQLVLTTGGTGLAPRDVTPEATLAVADKIVPGICEEIRRQSLRYTPNAMLSRAVSVICNNTLIINLPGSPKAVKECCDIIRPILPHAADLLGNSVKDCARN